MQTETIEAGGARSGTSSRRRAEHREDIDALKARMRGVIASLGMPRHVAQAALALVDIWQRGKGLFPEQATIALRAFYGERRTRDALKELRDVHGLLTWDRRRYRGVQTSNLYEWTPQFWALVNAPKEGKAGGKECRPQGAKNAARCRQSLPTNGDLPSSERSSLNGIQPCTEPPVMAEPPAAAPASQASPSPPLSEQQAEGAPADLATSRTLPPFVSHDDDPAFVELVTVHATAHAAKYRRAIEASGERYSARDAGTIRAELRPVIAAELRNLAARAQAIALSKFRDDLTTDAIRGDLLRRLVDAYMDQERPWLHKTRHCLGGLWGNGGCDGNPCDLLALAPRVLERWADALDPGDGPDLAEVFSHAPPNDEHREEHHHDLEPNDHDTDAERAEARAACEELRARHVLAELAEPEPVDPPEPLELELLEPRPRSPAEVRAALERIDAEAREARAASPPQPRARRGGRTHLATRPRERLALLAALRALAAPSAHLGDHEHDPHEERPAAPTWTAAAPPLLRDARERPARRAPRRARAPRGRP